MRRRRRISPRLLRWGWIGFGLLLLSWVGIVAALVVRLEGRALDDFYITFRYAWNFLDDHGLVFNPGERVFATTAPGYALLLGILGWLGRPLGIEIPSLANALTGVSLLVVAVLLLLENRRRRPEAALGGTLLVSSGYVWIHSGAELPVSLALLLAAACLGGWLGGRRLIAQILAGLLAALAVACRPDAGLAVGILGLLLWAERRRLPQAFGWSAAAGIAVGLVAAWWWFGQPLPATLEAKRFQAEWAPDVWIGGALYWERGLLFLRRWGFGDDLTIVLAGMVGCWAALRHGGRGLRLVVLYGLALAVAYPLLGVPFYPWYAEATVIALLYGLAFLPGWVGRRVHAFFRVPGDAAPMRARIPALSLTLSLTLMLVLVLVAPVFDFGRRVFQRPPEGGRFAVYQQAGEWIRAHSEPGEAVSFVEVGIVGYFSRRPIRDLVGLVSPENLEALRRHGSPERLLRDHPTALVIYTDWTDRLMGPVRDAPWFAERYDEVQRFEREPGGQELILYRRRP